MIRPRLDLSAFIEVLKALAGRVPLIALGLGLQGRARPSELHPSVRQMLALVDRHALVLGTRGLVTRDWLHKHGFENAQALGCPSLYCYPQSILDIDAKDLRAAGKDARVLTAGYLDRFHGGVAALQAGRPTIMLANDNRVQELSDFFGIPHMSNREFTRKGLVGAIEGALNDDSIGRMKRIYRQRHQEFAAAMAQHGINVVTRLL